MSAALVEEARLKARWLTQREARGPGDIENAMRRIEARYGVPYALLWALRYRPPKDMLVSPYVRLCNAYEAECTRQRRLLDHEESITKAKTGIGAALVRAARALAGEDTRSLNDEGNSR